MGFLNKQNEKMVAEIARLICAWWVNLLIQNQKQNKNHSKFISPAQRDKFSSVFENLIKEFLKSELNSTKLETCKEKLLFINNFSKVDLLLLAALEASHLEASALPKNCFSLVSLDENNSKITNFNGDNLQEVFISKN